MPYSVSINQSRNSHRLPSSYQHLHVTHIIQDAYNIHLPPLTIKLRTPCSPATDTVKHKTLGQHATPLPQESHTRHSQPPFLARARRGRVLRDKEGQFAGLTPDGHEEGGALHGGLHGVEGGVAGGAQVGASLRRVFDDEVVLVFHRPRLALCAAADGWRVDLGLGAPLPDECGASYALLAVRVVMVVVVMAAVVVAELVVVRVSLTSSTSDWAVGGGSGVAVFDVLEERDGDDLLEEFTEPLSMSRSRVMVWLTGMALGGGVTLLVVSSDGFSADLGVLCGTSAGCGVEAGVEASGVGGAFSGASDRGSSTVSMGSSTDSSDCVTGGSITMTGSTVTFSEVTAWITGNVLLSLSSAGWGTGGVAVRSWGGVEVAGLLPSVLGLLALSTRGLLGPSLAEWAASDALMEFLRFWSNALALEGVAPRPDGLQHRQPGDIAVDLSHDLRDRWRLGLAGTEALDDQVLADVVGEVLYGVACPLAEAVHPGGAAEAHALLRVVEVLHQQAAPHEATVAVVAPHKPKEQVVLELCHLDVGVAHVAHHHQLLLLWRHHRRLKELAAHHCLLVRSARTHLNHLLLVLLIAALLLWGCWLQLWLRVLLLLLLTVLITHLRGHLHNLRHLLLG
ncbi:hypothetical protein E2C01_020616 [Portunus trituberculatus]|uniref:Uncharacterized protein n=1 Tax=Portunus trituberculatus TaxID=210409 RepID=A0A5B7E2T0_PORTR|nr:hypothetical protein [Portunus trituberculatus]